MDNNTASDQYRKKKKWGKEKENLKTYLTPELHQDTRTLNAI